MYEGDWVNLTLRNKVVSSNIICWTLRSSLRTSKRIPTELLPTLNTCNFNTISLDPSGTFNIVNLQYSSKEAKYSDYEHFPTTQR